MNQMETSEDPVQMAIAVTGGAGSGKSFVCRHLVRGGGDLIDADQIAREVVMPETEGLKKVVNHFGSWVLAPDGTLNRPALRRKILTDDPARKALEAILHPEIISLMHARIKAAFEAGSRMVVAEVPLLFELGMADQFDKTVLVKARRDVKIKRLMARDGISETDARRLLDLQMSDFEKEKLSDIVIDNNGSIAKLIKNVDQIHKMIYL
jgi:dephospho-CoA kinase